MHKLSTPWRIAVGLIVLYLSVGTLFALLIPPWETPDAPSHYLYVRYVVMENALPLPEDVETGYAYPATLYEWHHPPLYYVVQAWVIRLTGGFRALLTDPEFVYNPAFSFSTPSARFLVSQWPWWTAHSSYAMVLRLRFSNMVFFGLPIVFIVYWMGVRLFDDSIAGAVLAIVTTMLPQSLYVLVSVQNDMAAILWSTAIWAIVISTISETVVLRWYHILAAGALVSLSMVSKLNVFPVSIVAVVWAIVYGRKLGIVKTLLLFWIPCSLVLLVYPLCGYDHAVALLGALAHGAASLHPTPMPLWTFTRILFASFWGRLGWMNVSLSPVLIFVFSVLSGVTWLGSSRQFVLKRAPFDQSARRRTFVWLLFGVLLQLLVVYIVFLPMQQPQGRFFFPALVPFWLLPLWPILSRKNTVCIWLRRGIVALVLVFNVVAWYRLYAVYWTG